MPANLENSEVATGLEKVSFHSNPKERQCKECSNYHTIALISHASKVMLKILQAKLQKYVNRELPDVQAGFRKVRGARDQITNLLQITEKDDGRISMCIDMAHWHAREGKFNSYEEFDALFNMLDRELGDSYLKNVHFHVSGIDYGDKGEKKHLPLRESDLRFEELLQSFVDHKLEGKVICESPNQEIDAMLLQDTYRRLSAK